VGGEGREVDGLSSQGLHGWEADVRSAIVEVEVFLRAVVWSTTNVHLRAASP
jgi:hypothetical protein